MGKLKSSTATNTSYLPYILNALITIHTDHTVTIDFGNINKISEEFKQFMATQLRNKENITLVFEDSSSLEEALDENSNIQDEDSAMQEDEDSSFHFATLFNPLPTSSSPSDPSIHQQTYQQINRNFS